jgi:hypothetical protein
VKQIIDKVLENKFRVRELLKDRKPFIENEAKLVLLPLQLACISEDKRTIARGSRIPLDLLYDYREKNTLGIFYPLDWARPGFKRINAEEA